MSLIPIVTYPNKILRKKSQKISDPASEEIKNLILDMGETMIKNEGIGLAAPQIGKNIRLFVVNTKEGIEAWINPKIVWKSRYKQIGEEGCLSIPKVFGPVKRFTEIKLEAQNSDGEKISFHAEGLYARVIQHEIDHLDGVLFIDKSKGITSGKDLLEQYEKLQ